MLFPSSIKPVVKVIHPLIVIDRESQKTLKLDTESPRKHDSLIHGVPENMEA